MVKLYWLRLQWPLNCFQLTLQPLLHSQFFEWLLGLKFTSDSKNILNGVSQSFVSGIDRVQNCLWSCGSMTYFTLCNLFPLGQTLCVHYYPIAISMVNWQTFTFRTFHAISMESNHSCFPNVMQKFHLAAFPPRTATLWDRLLCYLEYYNLNLFRSKVNCYLSYYLIHHSFKNNPLL